MSRYNLSPKLSTVVKPPLCAFIMTFLLLLINVTVSCFYCQTCLLPSTLWITISSLQDSNYSNYSISGIALEWLRSYLTNRSQFALIEGCRSQSRELKCGVPQGSVLGPVSEGIKFKILLLTFKALHQQSPTYIQDLITRYLPSRSLRSSSTLSVNPVSFNRKTDGSRAFFVSVSELWNKLPDDIRSCENRINLKPR